MRLVYSLSKEKSLDVPTYLDGHSSCGVRWRTCGLRQLDQPAGRRAHRRPSHCRTNNTSRTTCRRRADCTSRRWSHRRARTKQHQRRTHLTIVPDQSEASYEVQEQFLSRDLPNQAIGNTNAVTGEFQFSLHGKPSGKVTNITVDLSKLTSDESRRDNRIRTQWLESSKFPNAVFTSTDAQGLPETYTEGQDVSFKLTGNMTIRDVTKPVTFDVTGKLVGDTITGSATSQILMKDFGIDAPSIAGMLTVKDGVTIKLNFTAKEAK